MDATQTSPVANSTSSGEAPKNHGEILKSLRRSPLVGADLDVTRPVVPGRSVDL
jgi:hypothetical protein